MEAKNVTLWVYADSEQEVKNLQDELNNFVMNKYNQGVLIRANSMTQLLRRYGDNALVNAFLK